MILSDLSSLRISKNFVGQMPYSFIPDWQTLFFQSSLNKLSSDHLPPLPRTLFFLCFLRLDSSWRSARAAPRKSPPPSPSDPGWRCSCGGPSLRRCPRRPSWCCCCWSWRRAGSPAPGSLPPKPPEWGKNIYFFDLNAVINIQKCNFCNPTYPNQMAFNLYQFFFPATISN